MNNNQKKPNNYNEWTEEMVNEMMRLVDVFNLEKSTNKYGEKTLKTDHDSKQFHKVIAKKLNGKFPGKTLTGSSVSNKYHWVSATPEQREAMHARRKEGILAQKEKSKETTTVIDQNISVDAKRNPNLVSGFKHFQLMESLYGQVSWETFMEVAEALEKEGNN
jgi:hypothetical protein